MIIPVRCFTCHKVLGDKWEYYTKKVAEHQNKQHKTEFELEDLKITDRNDIFFSDNYKGKIMDDLKITKICCRRHMLGHVDLIDLL